MAPKRWSRRLCPIADGRRRSTGCVARPDPSKVGTPAGYRWGYILTPDGEDATVVTEVFDYGPLPEDLLSDGGAWINGTTSVRESMAASLEKLERISTE